MRILVVNWLDRRNPQAGGAEIHLHEVFGRLAARGHAVTLLCSGFAGGAARETVDGIDVHRVGGRLSFGVRVPGYLRKVLDPSGFDVVVEDLNKVPFFLPLLTRRPVVLLVHHLFGTTAFAEVNPAMAAATWLLERPVPRVFRNCSVIAVSESTAEDLRRRGMRTAPITVIHNGVDIERLTPDPEGKEFDEPTLLYLGRLKRYKRIDLILRAVARLREEGSSVHLLVAGKGNHERALRSLALRLGLGDVVEFLGYVDESEKLRLLRRSWVHVLTSPKEGWGISAAEAAACGTATVASDSPGLRDAVRHGETGLLVPHGNVILLAEAIRSLLNDPQARRRMGLAARRFAEELTWEVAADGVLEVLRASAERVASVHPPG